MIRVRVIRYYTGRYDRPSSMQPPSRVVPWAPSASRIQPGMMPCQTCQTCQNVASPAESSSMVDAGPPQADQTPPAWQSLPAIDRRVAGVLVEKAKTTPNAYPLTLNAIRTACNQKSNRDPVMQLEEDDLIESLHRLRALGAVTEIHGDSRVAIKAGRFS